jgi:hypothetical protein
LSTIRVSWKLLFLSKIIDIQSRGHLTYSIRWILMDRDRDTAPFSILALAYLVTIVLYFSSEGSFPNMMECTESSKSFGIPNMNNLEKVGTRENFGKFLLLILMALKPMRELALLILSLLKLRSFAWDIF